MNDLVELSSSWVGVGFGLAVQYFFLVDLMVCGDCEGGVNW